ncbi:MAG: ABC transporter transmembrane domain-containing protein [Thalassobaculum sp.]
MHLERLGAIDAIRESRAGYLPQLLVDFPFFILFVALVFLIGGPLGFVLLSFVAVTAVAALASGLSVRTRMEARQTNSSAQSNFLTEVLSGIATIKSYAMEPLMKRRYERVMESSATITARLVQGSITAQALTNLVTQAAQISIVAAGSLAVINGTMTIGGIAACMLLTGRALQPLNRASMLWSQYQSVRIAKQRIRELAAMPTIASGGGIMREVTAWDHRVQGRFLRLYGRTADLRGSQPDRRRRRNRSGEHARHLEREVEPAGPGRSHPAAG